MSPRQVLDGEAMRQLERARLRSLVAPDIAVAERLHAVDYQLITPGGITYNKAEYLGEIGSGALRYLVFEAASEIAVIDLGDGFAVRYRAHIDIRWDGGRDEGIFWHTDLWRRRDDGWQAVWSHATGLPGKA